MGNVKLKDKLMYTPTSIRLTERQLKFCNEQGEVSAYIRKLIDKDIKYDELLKKVFSMQENKNIEDNT